MTRLRYLDSLTSSSSKLQLENGRLSCDKDLELMEVESSGEGGENWSADLLNEPDLENVPNAPIIAQLQGLNITSIQQLLEPGLPRKELLVRALEQIQEHKSTITRLRYELQRSEESLKALFWVQNSLQLFRSLPNEVLGHIFVLSCENDEPRFDTDIHQPIRLTHICKHWREVALAVPALWVHIPLEKIALAVPFLQRSKSFPLEVQVYSGRREDRKKSRAMVLHLQRHVARIRRLQIAPSVPYDLLLSVLTAMKLSPVLSLEELIIDYPTAGALDNNKGERALGLLCANKPPPLRLLTIERLPVPWSSNLLMGGHLTHLEVYSQTSPPLSSFLDVLRANPSLLEIDLQNFTVENFLHHPPPHEAPVDPTDRIPLPLLRSLRFTRVDMDYEALLAHFDTPAAIHITYRFSPGAWTGMDPDDPAREQPHRLDRLLAHPHRRLAHLPAFQGEEVTAVHYRDLTNVIQPTARGFYQIASLNYWRECVDPPATPVPQLMPQLSDRVHPRSPPGSPSPTQPHGDPRRQLGIILEPTTVWGPYMFGALGSAIPLPNLHTLRLTRVPERQEAGWYMIGFEQDTYDTVFANLPALRTLVLEWCAFIPVLRALTPGVVAEDPADRGTEMGVEARCPRMTRLELFIPSEKDVYSIPEELVEPLHAFVLARTADTTDPRLPIERLKALKIGTIDSGDGTSILPVFSGEAVERIEELHGRFTPATLTKSVMDGATASQEIWEWTF